MRLADATRLWDPEPGWLNTASYGLPPRPAWDALQAALADWRAGRTSWEPWDESTGRARAAFALMTGAAPGDVAVGATVSGLLAPVDDILAAARGHGALVCVDASQACGWLPVRAASFDVLVCVAYKWLMAPRGAAFCYLAPELRERMRPLQADWYAGQDVHESYYGPPLRLAGSARRFDTSPAWFSFVGAAPAIELLNEIGVEAVHAHNVRLGRRFLAGLGLPPTESAIVSVAHRGAAERLAAAGVRAATRAGRARLSFHLYTTEADVDRALEALSSG